MMLMGDGACQDWMDGGEWGFAQQTKSGAIVPPPYLLLSESDIGSKLDTARSRWIDLKNTAFSQHVDYWNKTLPGGNFEHDRFNAGFDLGFSDALEFFNMRRSRQLVGPGADRIGMLDLWVRKRMIESGQEGLALVGNSSRGFDEASRTFTAPLGYK